MPPGKKQIPRPAKTAGRGMTSAWDREPRTGMSIELTRLVSGRVPKSRASGAKPRPSEEGGLKSRPYTGLINGIPFLSLCLPQRPLDDNTEISS